MNFKLLTFIIFLICFRSIGQEPVKYDSTLAKELGADEYGMKSYTFVILTTGDSIIEDKKRVQELFSGHLNNISRLSEEGKLIVAGPLGKNALDYRGLFIFDNESKEETLELLKTDPAIDAGLLGFEIFTWYGSAALPTYLNTHEKIQKTNF